MALEQNNTAFEFETMLRRQLSQKTGAHSSTADICAGFDADSANAYLENALGTTTRFRYESHLADCPPCRQHVIQLSRLIQLPQSEPQFAPIVKPASIWSHWKSIAAEWLESLDASLGKQGWATAGVAAAVLITVTSAQIWRQQQTMSPVEQPKWALTIASATPQTPISEVQAGSNTELTASADFQNLQRLATNKVPTPQVSPMPGDTSATSLQLLTAGSKPSVEFFPSVLPAPPQPVTNTLVSSVASRTVLGAPVQNVSIEQAAPPPPAADAQQNESVVAAHINPSPSDNPMAKKSKDPKPSSRSVFDKALSFMPTRKEEGARKLEEKAIEPDAPRVLAVRRRDKVFNYQGGFWVDSAYKPEMAWRVTKLTLDSAEFDQVLAAEPLLKEYFAHGPAIVVWKDKIYKLVSK